ncbi:hypothetical protein BDB00DRAFT_317522 [Zychaea mexicana]|uniref:uncharacterized protein n=1 Tax=Zychaea mexicana TaxID=64656 RepID=UPI0022FDE470|nr:uncharacterized protein BDB00DRAFT_317522 [Zychaea mexicana]KAI9494224.1 hypothetical protein BDB00DRAFT_317522 [Zychaea mexicana]
MDQAAYSEFTFATTELVLKTQEFFKTEDKWLDDEDHSASSSIKSYDNDDNTSSSHCSQHRKLSDEAYQELFDEIIDTSQCCCEQHDSKVTMHATTSVKEEQPSLPPSDTSIKPSIIIITPPATPVAHSTIEQEDSQCVDDTAEGEHGVILRRSARIAAAALEKRNSSGYDSSNSYNVKIKSATRKLSRKKRVSEKKNNG